MKYYIVKSILEGDIVVRAENKRELEEYLDEIELSYMEYLTIKDYADQNLGVGGKGIIVNR